MTDFLGTGWAFPVTLDRDGNIATASELDVINRSIELILGTAKGERLMRPDFGSDLFNFVFQPLNHSNKRGMATAVKTALQKWEKRVRLVDVIVSNDAIDRGTALINIEYEVRSSNTKGNLVYPFYLGGEAGGAEDR